MGRSQGYGPILVPLDSRFRNTFYGPKRPMIFRITQIITNIMVLDSLCKYAMGYLE